MPAISDAVLRVRLPSGNDAVYLVSPQHVPRDDTPASREWPQMFGRQLAHAHGGRWYSPGGWEEITDLRTIALLERATDA